MLEDIDTYSTTLVNIHMIYTGQNEPQSLDNVNEIMPLTAS